ncbi:hypothetical protein BST81_25240 [Leptolyngbya sp. 'hensonii']|uniref:tetratricopeptide repeat protein n=1 Tax=Leptolyngbya sp. 'hensonii' TaxID=1922337 RepID=UPI00094FDDC5|nr:tetratricopeptide repeat protein [Leptolyngbya sp. 'hensonii']OLP15660.1 hypothetical protein BST81_25240 [Leptolyngbya sp. 'hensonii']
MTRDRLGADHPDVATSLNNLAGLYRSQGRYAEAESLYLQAIMVFHQRLGADHPYTKGTFNRFVNLLQQVLEHGQADRLSGHPYTQDLLRQIRANATEP